MKGLLPCATKGARFTHQRYATPDAPMFMPCAHGHGGLRESYTAAITIEAVTTCGARPVEALPD